MSAINWSASISIFGGIPSISAPTAGPWDSPKRVTTMLSPRLMRTSISQCEKTFIQEYGYSSIDANSALIIFVSINSTSPALLYHFFNCSIVWVFTAGAKTAIAGPEPLIPAARAPFTNASLVNFLPTGSFSAPTTPLPFHVRATRSFPSCSAFRA